MQKWLVWDVVLYLKFGKNWLTLFKNTEFQSIFTCSASVVTIGGKSSIMTNRKSVMCFPIRLRWTAYIAPKGGLKNAKWPFSHKTAVTTDELKEAVVAMMMRKEEVEEQMKYVFVVFRVSLKGYFFLVFSWV